MQTQDYEDYQAECLRHLGRTPLSGSFELTAKCNLSCRHCYMVPYRDEPELSTAEAYDNLEASGSAANKKDRDTTRTTEVYLFDDENDAEAAEGDIQDYVDQQEDDESWTNTKVEQSGRWVTVTAEIDIDDLFD